MKSKSSEATRTTDPKPFVPVSEVPKEQLPVIHIRQERRDALEICATKRAKDSPGTVDRHIRGIKGEFAVAKHYGNPESVDTEVYQNGDDGVDLRIQSDTQVKTCRPRVNTPRLMVDARKDLNAEHYFLVQELDRSTYRLIGYAPVSTLKSARVQKVTLDGYAKRLRVVPQCDLWQPPRPVYRKETL